MRFGDLRERSEASLSKFPNVLPGTAAELAVPGGSAVELGYRGT